MKICPKCTIEKEDDLFYKRANGKCTSWCISCMKDWDNSPEGKSKHKNALLKLNFGISLIQYNEMLENQNFKCQGCYRHISELKKALAVDHNHVTGKVRGLLCMSCNTILGHAKDNVDILRNLIDYLTED